MKQATSVSNHTKRTPPKMQASEFVPRQVDWKALLRMTARAFRYLGSGIVPGIGRLTMDNYVVDKDDSLPF